MEEVEFSKVLQEEVNKKLEWYNSFELQNMLNQYRLIHSCVKNLYDMLVRRSLITNDPYRLDKRISEIVLPDSQSFPDTDIPVIFGARLSDYETMLDFICTYFRFSVENLTIQKIKKMISFNNFFDWEEISVNSPNANTRAFAIVLEESKKGCDSVNLSMIGDSLQKCFTTTSDINKELKQLAVFQRELYKCELRKDIFEHPEFRIEKAKVSEESELAEIKRIYGKVASKRQRPFYNDLISEIIQEDHAPDKEKIQEAVLKKVRIEQDTKKKKTVKKQAPDNRKMLMGAVSAIGVLAPIISTLYAKLSENFDILFENKKTFFSRLSSFFKKIFGIGEKKRVIFLPVKDYKTSLEKEQRVPVAEFLHELSKRVHIYNGIATKGPEYTKVEGASEEAILNFVTKQVSEMQALFNFIKSLDGYFKTNVDSISKNRLRSVQMELSTFRNAIINVNKKRGEYVSYKEESEQMKKLGIVDEDE